MTALVSGNLRWWAAPDNFHLNLNNETEQDADKGPHRQEYMADLGEDPPKYAAPTGWQDVRESPGRILDPVRTWVCLSQDHPHILKEATGVPGIKAQQERAQAEASPDLLEAWGLTE
ncbi:hypothetical protein GWK47_037990 [Chionoecetes opilio]|uniref:Uncharacterized protein n=1 Tax=Chionoecetes opilio TaxID=41210 RepID=A0A8J4YD48_CHIOP|nr:hypothetical protein GWK47_037990 [Chionoecetes opilio]